MVAPRVKIDLTISERHARYLRDRADIGINPLPVSHVLEKILESEKAAIGAIEAPTQTVLKIRKCFKLPPEHVDFIDALAKKWGLSRSQCARRLIGKALAKDRV